MHYDSGLRPSAGPRGRRSPDETPRFDGFHDGIGRFDRHEALKIVFYPAGREAAQERLEVEGAVTA